MPTTSLLPGRGHFGTGSPQPPRSSGARAAATAASVRRRKAGAVMA
ncbi:MAG: hypothetical protein R3F11_06410 [Verrucomicrobiales bacterium]